MYLNKDGRVPGSVTCRNENLRLKCRLWEICCKFTQDIIRGKRNDLLLDSYNKMMKDNEEIFREVLFELSKRMSGYTHRHKDLIVLSVGDLNRPADRFKMYPVFRDITGTRTYRCKFDPLSCTIVLWPAILNYGGKPLCPPVSRSIA